MENKEIEILKNIQETMETKWWSYLVKYLNDEIEANKEILIEWWDVTNNKIQFNYYDILRSETAYLQWLLDRFELMKKDLQNINIWWLEDEI